MPTRGPLSFRSLCLFAAMASGVGGGVAFAAGAEDKEAADRAGASSTALRASDEASISAAKRDLDLIKTSKENATRPAGALPSMTVPELQPGLPDLSPRSGKKRDDEAGAAKSGNWLVDGVRRAERASATALGVGSVAEKDSRESGRDRAGDLGEPNGAASETGRAEMLELGARSGGARPAKEDARTVEQRAAAANPLTPFMQGWMTSQDYALLKPNDSAMAGIGIGEGATGKAGSGAELGVGAGSEGLAALVGNSGQMRGGAGSPSGLAAARENPFLEFLGAPTPTSVAQASGLGPASGGGVGGPVGGPPSSPQIALPANSVAPSAASTPQVAVPDFAKPKTDDKYFKPLKRF